MDKCGLKREFAEDIDRRRSVVGLTVEAFASMLSRMYGKRVESLFGLDRNKISPVAVRHSLASWKPDNEYSGSLFATRFFLFWVQDGYRLDDEAVEQARQKVRVVKKTKKQARVATPKRAKKPKLVNVSRLDSQLFAAIRDDPGKPKQHYISKLKLRHDDVTKAVFKDLEASGRVYRERIGMTVGWYPTQISYQPKPVRKVGEQVFEIVGQVRLCERPAP
jgi:hypothetical protein